MHGAAALLLSAAALATASGSAAAAAAASAPTQVFHVTFLTEAAARDGAVCLDGSPAAYYFFQGAKSTSYYIHQEGGGWCNSDEDCLSRSKTALGSSKSYAATISQTTGYFSPDPAINPLMHDWSKIYLPYCGACAPPPPPLPLLAATSGRHTCASARVAHFQASLHLTPPPHTHTLYPSRASPPQTAAAKRAIWQSPLPLAAPRSITAATASFAPSSPRC
jgi:hypothetical protein